jgi:hypothetical protein
MTLRTVSDIFFELGYKATIGAIPGAECYRDFLRNEVNLFLNRNQGTDWKLPKQSKASTSVEQSKELMAA